MRPSCEKILEMPVIRAKSQKLFPQDFFDPDPPQMNLLSTIRVPKNLLYLTDRLPKPNYDSDEKARREKEELLRRRTYEGSSALLPDIQHSNGTSGGNGSIQGS
jgi:NIMA (never in mitosis gene a)-related kinase